MVIVFLQCMYVILSIFGFYSFSPHLNLFCSFTLSFFWHLMFFLYIYWHFWLLTFFGTLIKTHGELQSYMLIKMPGAVHSLFKSYKLVLKKYYIFGHSFVLFIIFHSKTGPTPVQAVAVTWVWHWDWVQLFIIKFFSSN